MGTFLIENMNSFHVPKTPKVLGEKSELFQHCCSIITTKNISKWDLANELLY